MVDYLERYLSEVERLSNVSRPERRELLVRARAGDTVAKKAAVESYLFDTARIAMESQPDWLSPLDKIQEANVVLFRCIDDPTVEDVIGALKSRIPEILRSVRRQDPPELNT